MEAFYSDSHRELQDEFGTRALADRLAEHIIADRLDDGAKAFISAQDLFFLATVDADGQPTVSYKGGPVGVVRVVDETTVAFPVYDGNGMFLSIGNLEATHKVGLLFISFESPMRMRVQGLASIWRDCPFIGDYPEAKCMVRVDVTSTWMNCPRYIHRYQRLSTSRYVPQAEKITPLAGWQHVEEMQDVLPADIAGRAREEGYITEEEWIGRVQAGHPEA